MLQMRGLEFPFGLMERPVSVWIPPDYDQGRRYPVVYAHDGQNLMDPSTSFLGIDWRLGCAASRLIDDGVIRAPLIVMIDNAGVLRYSEYGDTPLGQLYRDWIAKTLKPAVDEEFATLPGRGDTFSMGSSMGGLVSFLCCWRHSAVFGGAACLSPVFPGPLIAEVAMASGDDGWLGSRHQPPPRLYIDNGGDTLGNLVQINSWRPEDHFWGRLDTQLQVGIDAMMLVMRARGMMAGPAALSPVIAREGGGNGGCSKALLQWYRDAGAPHNEDAWASRAWRPLEHLLSHDDDDDDEYQRV